MVEETPPDGAVVIWRAPLTVAAITAFGLVIALFVDGAADAAGWIALAVPVAVVGWFASPRVQRRRTLDVTDT